MQCLLGAREPAHLVNSSIGRPAISDVDISFEDFTLGLFEEEGVEIIFDRGIVCAGLVGDSR